MVSDKPSLPPTINLSMRSIWSPWISLAAEQASGVGKIIPTLGWKKLSFQQCSAAPHSAQGQLHTGTFAALLAFDLHLCPWNWMIFLIFYAPPWGLMWYFQYYRINFHFGGHLLNWFHAEREENKQGVWQNRFEQLWLFIVGSSFS